MRSMLRMKLEQLSPQELDALTALLVELEQRNTTVRRFLLRLLKF